MCDFRKPKCLEQPLIALLASLASSQHFHRLHSHESVPHAIDIRERSTGDVPINRVGVADHGA
jgi:hypothetical protein